MRFPRYFVFVFACKHRRSFAWTPVLLSLELTFSLVKARRKNSNNGRADILRFQCKQARK